MTFQRMVTANPPKKGFSCQATRFSSQVGRNNNPGPGSYDCTKPTCEITGPSFSKKGTTGFVASKAVQGYFNPQRSVPGPNVYNLQDLYMTKHDFNPGVSRVFRSPVSELPVGQKHQTPAPNQYDVSCEIRLRSFSLLGSSTFVSKTGRRSFCPNTDAPSPCHYVVNNQSIQLGSKAVLSPFKSKSQRILALLDHRVPGPGAYSPHRTPTPVKRTTLPRGSGLTISEPALVPPKDPPVPGPGHYEIRTCYDGGSKRPAPTAAFASKTGRGAKDPYTDIRPGPGVYDPRLWSKSFFYNVSRIWIQV